MNSFEAMQFENIYIYIYIYLLRCLSKFGGDSKNP